MENKIQRAIQRLLLMGKCKKCGRETIKNFFKERREWCEEMNKKLENAGVNIFRYT